MNSRMRPFHAFGLLATALGGIVRSSGAQVRSVHLFVTAPSVS
jgi:hypothetical protein